MNGNNMIVIMVVCITLLAVVAMLFSLYKVDVPFPVEYYEQHKQVKLIF